MANEVFANTREISCKSGDGKSICAFPDVCLSPPSPPAGPIPIPYPNTAFAKDTTSGSKKVKISKKEVMLKNKSYFKKSTGDEAATKSLGMGVVTHQIQGKVYFTSWSMDVKVEGENVVRHLDLTTHNHMSTPGNTPPWMHVDMMAFEQTGGKVCKDQEKKAEDACKDSTVSGSGSRARRKCSDECKKAQKCVLVPKNQDKKKCCTPENTGHHLLEVHCFTPTGGRSAKKRLGGLEKYNDGAAPTVCASASRYSGTHGILHAVQNTIEAAFNAAGGVLKSWAGAGALDRSTGARGAAQSKWTYAQSREAGVFAHKTAFPHCNSVCTEKQLDAYHKDKCGMEDDAPLRTDPVARKGGELADEQGKALMDEVGRVQGIPSGTRP